MEKEIEADGFITKGIEVKKTCVTCKCYKYENSKRDYICSKGHFLNNYVPDWRREYEVCDEWERKQV